MAVSKIVCMYKGRKVHMLCFCKDNKFMCAHDTFLNKCNILLHYFLLQFYPVDEDITQGFNCT